MTEWVLRVLLGLLGQWIAQLVIQLRKARADNADLLTAINSAVLFAETQSATWNGPQKRTYVYGQMVQWCKDFGVDVRDSLLNALIEVAVVSLPPTREPARD